MEQTKHQLGVTFAVDEVTPATKPLTQCRMYEAVKKNLESEIESCSDYHGMVIKGIRYQPLLAAVYTAFNNHYPLVLSPDMVWITIVQGVAHHMVAHGERLRDRFVSHQGKLNLSFVVLDWVEGSPENPWADAFASWTEQIRDHVGPQVHDTLLCDFSTSGPVELAVSQIVIMDIFERYFKYDIYGICGIPSITLEGTTADWQRLADKAARLSVFNLDWWLAHLLPICDQFVRASRGDVDLDHWQNICKLRKEYGGAIINGWIAKLFPYLRAFIKGPCTRRNPIFETGEGFQTMFAPSGLSQVPFRWHNLETKQDRSMEAIGGLIGVCQDEKTLALRSKVGWAVREAEKYDVLLDRLASEHTTFPGWREEKSSLFPLDLGKFYCKTNGAKLFTEEGRSICYILPAEELLELDWGERPRDFEFWGPTARMWCRLAILPDGSWLAINLDPSSYHLDPRPKQKTSKFELWMSKDPPFSPICHCISKNQSHPARNPVIALSFTELLERMLESAQNYWLDPSFVSYGKVEEFTRQPNVKKIK